jgi:hypothetical protein
MGRECGLYRGKERCVFEGKPDRKRLLGKPMCSWEDNIKMDLKEVGWGNGLNPSGSGQVASSCEYSNEPSSCIKLGELLD